MTATGCADNTEVTLVQISGGGHTWPANRFSLPPDVVGPTSFAVNASRQAPSSSLLRSADGGDPLRRWDRRR